MTTSHKLMNSEYLRKYYNEFENSIRKPMKSILAVLLHSRVTVRRAVPYRIYESPPVDVGRRPRPRTMLYPELTGNPDM